MRKSRVFWNIRIFPCFSGDFNKNFYGMKKIFTTLPLRLHLLSIRRFFLKKTRIRKREGGGMDDGFALLQSVPHGRFRHSAAWSKIRVRRCYKAVFGPSCASLYTPRRRPPRPWRILRTCKFSVPLSRLLFLYEKSFMPLADVRLCISSFPAFRFRPAGGGICNRFRRRCLGR